MPNTREKLIELIKAALTTDVVYGGCKLNHPAQTVQTIADHLIANGVTVIPPEGIGEMSDGYHTFNELYHHRAVLFSVICNAMPDKAWKSKRHDTGDMYDGMFIVGIETNHGQATYHYDVDPYWDMFNVPELEYAPKWDGHTPQEAIDRIAHGLTVQEWISVKDRLPERNGQYLCNYHFGKHRDMTFTSVLYYYATDEVPHFQHTLGDDYMKVTHWMPLPQPPKGE